MIQLDMEFSQQLDSERLANAVNLTLDAEPVLGCKFVENWRKPYWERLSRDKLNVFDVVHTEAELEVFKLSPIDEYDRPQVSVRLWNTPAKSRLLIKVSHYASDAAGVKDVARIISSIYARLADDPNYRPNTNLNGSRSARQVLKSVPKGKYLSLFRQFMSDTRACEIPKGTQTLLFKDGESVPLVYVNRTLLSDHVSVLVEYGHKYGSTLNDILLAAFFRALVAISNWDGQNQLRVTATLDLRNHIPEWYAESVANLSLGIIGWPSLGTDIGNDFPSTLERVSRITKQRKQNYLGIETLLGSLLLLNTPPHSWSAKILKQRFDKLTKQGNAPICLTNMGSIDPTVVTFDTKPLSARLLPPINYPPSFAVGVSGYDGTLTLSSGIASINKDITDQFLDAMVSELPN